MILPILAASLWLASQADRPLPVEYKIVKVDKFADGLAVDLGVNGLGMSADLISTKLAIDSGKCREGNPVVEAGGIGVKIALSTVRAIGSYLLRSRGHKTYADIWRWSGLAADLGITASNLSCKY